MPFINPFKNHRTVDEKIDELAEEAQDQRRVEAQSQLQSVLPTNALEDSSLPDAEPSPLLKISRQLDSIRLAVWLLFWLPTAAAVLLLLIYLVNRA